MDQTRFRFRQGQCHPPSQHGSALSFGSVVVGCCCRSIRSSIQCYRSPYPQMRIDPPATKPTVQNAATSKNPTHDCFSIMTTDPSPHTTINKSQILPTRRSPTTTSSRRHPDPHATSNRSRRPHTGRIDSALDQTDRRQDPFVATTLHALPSVLSDVGFAFGTLEAAVEFSLLEFGSHPGEGVEEVVAAGGGGVGGFVVC